MKPSGKVTGLVTVDLADRTVVMTVTNMAKGRAVTVYMTRADARRLARTLTSGAKGGR